MNWLAAILLSGATMLTVPAAVNAAECHTVLVNGHPVRACAPAPALRAPGPVQGWGPQCRTIRVGPLSFSECDQRHHWGHRPWGWEPNYYGNGNHGPYFCPPGHRTGPFGMFCR